MYSNEGRWAVGWVPEFLGLLLSPYFDGHMVRLYLLLLYVDNDDITINRAPGLTRLLLRL